jgi:glycosyltransferase involved in cell wall biosynthesis
MKHRPEDLVFEGQNIICFAKDWSEDPTSNNHVMRILARRNKVLWVNSIGMRKPNLASGRDLRKMGRALKRFTDGPVQVAEGLWVFSPLVVPLPHSAWASAINRQILTRTIAALRRRLGMDRFQLWTFLPNVARYLGRFGESLLVYYCTDEFSQFSYLDGARILAEEQQLCRRADIVFTTARTLWERRRPLNSETHLALHGVDHQHFAAALESETVIPAELANVPGPIIGFFGLIHDWIDLGLISYIAERRPDWTIAIIGKANVDISSLRRRPNVRILGQKPYADLPNYCKAFSLGMLPFVVNELTRNVNPIKLREYLSAGLPVVSTELPETSGYAHCQVARSPEEFLAACQHAIATDTPTLRRMRSDAMAGETWEARVNEIGRTVLDVARRRGSAAAQERRPDEVAVTQAG